jgi:hypothetical protein
MRFAVNVGQRGIGFVMVLVASLTMEKMQIRDFVILPIAIFVVDALPASKGTANSLLHQKPVKPLEFPVMADESIGSPLPPFPEMATFPRDALSVAFARTVFGDR